jgi:hypothetical protein
MSDDLPILKSLQHLLGLEKKPGDIDPSDKSLIKYIEKRVEELINSNFQGLLQILYRLDVNEKELKENIDNTSPDKVARLIAEMILKREKQKLNSKEEYRQFMSGNNDDNDEERW